MRRRWLVPEAIQTSSTDCGPAVLQALLRGHGVEASYQRLREACATDVDGTSFDTLEELAEQLGFEVDKALLPVDHLLFRGHDALPAIVVMRLPSGMAHFVLAWRRHGPWIQLMDPGGGRRFMRVERFLAEVYTHAMPMPSNRWRAWIEGQPSFHQVLRTKLRRLGVPRASGRVDEVLADPGWRPLAALDASARMTAALVTSGGLRPGREAATVFERLLERASAPSSDDEVVVPGAYWSAVPLFGASGATGRVSLRGVPVIRILGAPRLRERTRRAARPATESPATESRPDPVRALLEPQARPGAELWRQLAADGPRLPLLLGLAIVAASIGEGIEALLLRALIDAEQVAPLAHQQVLSVLLVLGITLGVLCLDRAALAVALGMGRRLELGLRARILAQLPRLDDHYFRTRPGSDLAARVHALHRLRTIPDLAQRFARASCRLIILVAGLAWILPDRSAYVLAGALASVAIPMALMPRLVEQDLRIQVHEGGLARYYLDALRGLVPIRSHGGEAAVSREHESLVVQWARARRTVARNVVAFEVLEGVVSVAVVASLLLPFVTGDAPLGALVLVAYWGLLLPAVGRELALTARQYPTLRNLTLRLLEPLGFETHAPRPDTPPRETGDEGVAIELEGVSVASGRQAKILDGVSLCIEAGAEVAIVGPSGAGKSSLVGLLLGWLRPSEGRIRIDGEPLTEERLAWLRSQTAWVDPSIHLWNRSLLDNVLFGAPPVSGRDLAEVTRTAELHDVLEHLPEGLRSSLGEGGGGISGGEGQRVRMARAMLRRDARLVIFDEPFRGLDEERRRALLARARQHWAHATFLYITHDVRDALRFPRVLVVDDGTIQHDDAPQRLLSAPSGLTELVEAARAVRDELWDDPCWRRLRLRAGQILSGPP